jgi:hypothetical protein
VGFCCGHEHLLHCITGLLAAGSEIKQEILKLRHGAFAAVDASDGPGDQRKAGVGALGSDGAGLVRDLPFKDFRVRQASDFGDAFPEMRCESEAELALGVAG